MGAFWKTYQEGDQQPKHDRPLVQSRLWIIKVVDLSEEVEDSRHHFLQYASWKCCSGRLNVDQVMHKLLEQAARSNIRVRQKSEKTSLLVKVSRARDIVSQTSW